MLWPRAADKGEGVWGGLWPADPGWGLLLTMFFPLPGDGRFPEQKLSSDQVERGLWFLIGNVCSVQVR